MDLPDMPRERLREYFPDFAPWQRACRFGNCLHYKETECGVMDAVKAGKIPGQRYHDYVLMLEEVMEKERTYE
jgi:ribosome biogenesis GTPase